ncbi:MAG: HpcH/HpaI aldolase/citrate lyase family protein [Sphingomonadaceae bacterium]
MPVLRHCRSLLFLPASNPRAIGKAGELPCDAVLLDLEDAVAGEDKAAARGAAVEAVAAGFGGRLVAIRINHRESPHYSEDLAAVRSSAADCVILPKVEDAEAFHDAANIIGKPALAMIETPRGVMNAVRIAEHAAGLVAGTNDLRAHLAIPPGAGRQGLFHALQSILLAARAGGCAAFDGVHNALDDAKGFAAECEEGAAFGFDGKTLVHPSQIAPCNRIFAPSQARLAEARRLVAAAKGGAQRFEGRMIEELHVAEAEALIARAEAQAAR